MSLTLVTSYLLRSEWSPLIWTGASIILRTIAARLAWWLMSSDQSLPARIATAYRGWSLQPVSTGLARLAYHLGIPYAALILGVLPARAMGLTVPQPEPHLIWLLPLGFGALLVLGLAWTHYLRVTGQFPTPLPGPFADQLQTLTSPWGWGIPVREAIYQQAHWGFYRGALIWFLGDVYWSSWLGLALVGFEAWANPFARQSLNRPGQAQASLLTASLAVIATAAFILSRNLWITTALHVVIVLALSSLLVLICRRTMASALFTETTADGSTALTTGR